MSANDGFTSDTSASKLSGFSDAELSDSSVVPILEDVGAGKKKIGGKKNKSAARRLHWPLIEKPEKIKGGGECMTFPFLQDSNLMDSVLVNHLLVEKPFVVPRGQVTKSWGDLVSLLNKETDSRTGKPVFDPPVNVQATRNRFDMLMAFARAHQNKVDLRSGNDDESPPTTIQRGVESLYQQLKDSEIMSEAAKQKGTRDQKTGKWQADQLRQASLGHYTSTLTDEEEDDADYTAAPDETPGPTASASAAAARMVSTMAKKSSSSAKRTPSKMTRGVMLDQTFSLQEAYTKQTDLKIQKAENKKQKDERKMELKKQKLDLKANQLEIEKAEREARLQIEKERLEMEKERLEMEKAEREANRVLMLSMAATISKNTTK